MIVLSAGCGSLMQLMQEDKKRGGPANGPAPSKVISETKPETYLTLCSASERHTR